MSSFRPVSFHVASQGWVGLCGLLSPNTVRRSGDTDTMRDGHSEVTDASLNWVHGELVVEPLVEEPFHSEKSLFEGFLATRYAVEDRDEMAALRILSRAPGEDREDAT
mgnify:CR=1 FL=1